jgi:hypothetical protein
MKRFTQILFLSLLFSSSAHATLLGFEDVPGGSLPNTFGDMPNYKGFSFSSTLDWIDVVGAPYNYGAKTGQFAILNNSTGIGTIKRTSLADFTFGGLWAKKYGSPIQSGSSVTPLVGTLKGFKSGTEVWSVNTSVNGSYKFFAGNSIQIDELRLGFGNYFLVDDINLIETKPVPEPFPLALFSIGLLCFGLLRKRHS